MGSTAADSSDDGSETNDTGNPMTVCEGDCVFVRAGADGSGADWDDALPELPAALERGRIYFIAGGTYPGHTFDDPPSDGAMIRVLRATDGDHGTDAGWQASYASDPAVFGPLAFLSSEIELDGRGNTRIVGEYEGTVVDIGADAVILRGCELDGNFQESDGNQTDGACTGLNISGDDIVVAGNEIHDAADDGVSIAGSRGLSFEGNSVHALHGCGTDGECGPCYNGHSDGIELYDVHDSALVGNLVYDVASTSAVFFGNWADELGNGADEYCENILLANNLLYSPETGFVAYIEDSRGIQLFHNVLWGLHQGAYGGLSIGTNVADLELYNNAILSINYTHIGGEHDAAEHRGDYNLFGIALGQWPEQAHDVIAEDPAFAGIAAVDGPAVEDPSPEDFAPADGSAMLGAGYPGDDTIVLPTSDYFGDARGNPPSIGAIE